MLNIWGSNRPSVRGGETDATGTPRLTVSNIQANVNAEFSNPSKL